MPLPTEKIADLNARRRRAVQLRVDGRPLVQIRDETGLSSPTILQAFRAFTGGGWRAIDVRRRGRPRGAGRTLSTEQERCLVEWLLRCQPVDLGLVGTALWSVAAVRQLIVERFGVEPPARAILRMLERVGLSFRLPREIDQHSMTPTQREWLLDTWPVAQASARSAPARLYWCGLASLNVWLPRGEPMPAGRGSKGDVGVHLMVAMAPRGNLLWLPACATPDAAAHMDFLTRLRAAGTGPCVAMLHGPDLRRASALADWLTAQAPRLQVIASPVALSARRTPTAMVLEAQSPQPPGKLPPGMNPPNSRRTEVSLVPTDMPPSAARSRAPISPTTDRPMTLTHLQRLEAESIHIMREVVSECEKPVMLYSIGKDSAVMLHLARKAFFPSVPPFPLLHVDTTWKFRAMYEMRSRMAEEIGMDLLVYHNPEAKELGINPFDHGSQIHTDMWKTQGLKQALDKYGFDAAFGGARRDEEKSRAKERVFSFRSTQHRWDPKSQRPELWRLYNGRKAKGESIRVFPISNWTELDIWQYIHLENIPIVPLYLAKERPVVERDGSLIMVDDERMPLKEGEVPMMKKVRFRTLGCYPLTGAVESEADSLMAIIQEMLLTKTSERQGRVIDHDASASMEKKKQEGYF